MSNSVAAFCVALITIRVTLYLSDTSLLIVLSNLCASVLQ